MPGTNTLAYYVNPDKKKFYNIGPRLAPHASIQYRFDRYKHLFAQKKIFLENFKISSFKFEKKIDCLSVLGTFHPSLVFEGDLGSLPLQNL